MSTLDYPVVAAMRRYGGGFVKALAEAVYLADPAHAARLKAAFPEVWLKYGALAERDAQAERDGTDR